MKKKDVAYIKPFKNVFLICKELLGYKEHKSTEYIHKKGIYDGEVVLKFDSSLKFKQRRKLKKLNRRFDELWMSYEDASYYLYRKHYINKLELCNHIFFWVVLAIFLALTIFVYCNSLQSDELFQTIFLGATFAFIAILYGFCVLTNVLKNNYMKSMLKRAKKDKDKVILKIKKLLKKSPLCDENTSLDFLDEHINTMYENELANSQNNQELIKVVEKDENSINIEQDKDRNVVSTTTFDESVLEESKTEIIEEQDQKAVADLNENKEETIEGVKTPEDLTQAFDSNNEVKSTTKFDESILESVDSDDSVFNKVDENVEPVEMVEKVNVNKEDLEIAEAEIVTSEEENVSEEIEEKPIEGVTETIESLEVEEVRNPDDNIEENQIIEEVNEPAEETEENQFEEACEVECVEIPVEESLNSEDANEFEEDVVTETSQEESFSEDVQEEVTDSNEIQEEIEVE